MEGGSADRQGGVSEHPVRVVLSPGVEKMAAGIGFARDLAAGAPVVSLRGAGVRTLRRALSPAEVHSARRALLGLGPTAAVRARPADEAVVGFLCTGRVLRPAGGSVAPRSDPWGRPELTGRGAGESSPEPVAVGDHLNLTWRSPLAGPNDESLGPRFPAMAGIYDVSPVKEVFADRAVVAVVACVADAGHLRAFEEEVVLDQKIGWVSDELASVSILAAHLGYKVAAALVVDGETNVPAGGHRGEDR